MKLKRTGFLTAAVLIAVAIFAVVTIVRLGRQTEAKNNEAETLENRIMYENQEKRQWQEKNDKLDTDDGIIEAARENGMVANDEYVFKDN